MSDTKYLRKHFQTWQFRMRVPKDVRQFEDHDFVVLTLDTGDLGVARRLRDQELGRLQEKWSALRSGLDSDVATPSGLVYQLEQLLQQARRGELQPPADMTEDEYAFVLSSELTDRHLSANQGSASDALADTVRSLNSAIANPDDITLGNAITEYLSEQTHVTPKTLGKKTSRMDMLKEFYGSSRRIIEIDRKAAKRFVTQSIRSLQLVPASQRSILTEVSHFFEWARNSGYVDDNAFDGMAKTIKDSTRGTTSETDAKPWTSAALTQTFGHFPLDRSTWKQFAAGALLLYTGARREEILQLKPEHVVERGTGLQITEGKTSSAVRIVPIHPIIKPLVSWLKSQSSSDGYLIPGYTDSGNGRADKWATTFRNWQVKSGTPLRKDGGFAVHDLRHTFKTFANTAKLDPRIIKQIMGHAEQGMDKIYGHAIDHKTCLAEIKQFTITADADKFFVEQITKLIS